MSKQSTKDARDLVMSALNASEYVTEARLGPRSTEVTMVTDMGVTVTITVRVKEVLA